VIDENSLLELCQQIVASAQKKGATAVEVQAQSNSEMESNIEIGQISGVHRKNAYEISIRVYLNKKMGSAFTNIPSRYSVEEAIDLAITASKATTVDEDWKALPQPEKYPMIVGLWNDDVSKCEPLKVVEMAVEFMAKAVDAESDLIPAFGGSGVLVQSSAYANSNGIAHAEKGTIVFNALAAIAQTESGTTPSIVSYDIRRDFDLDLDRAVDDISSMIRVCKRTAKGATGKNTVVMHPSAYGQLLYFTLIQAVRGDNVVRGKSKIADKVGEKVASDSITIVDDGILPEAVNTSVSDDEGVPHQRTSIMERGILRTFLWDSYWANNFGETSTGNAVRNMRHGLIEIAPTSMIVEPGKREIGDIISEIKCGYLIRNVQGAHSSNPESGDFSIVGNPAILIQDGEMVGAVHGLMVAGNIFELLRQAVEVAKTPISLQSLIGPEIVFHDVNVITRDWS
jgi:PmbA protein